jgi:hypothetical protein
MWTTKNHARYERKGLRYEGDLTDEEYALIEPFLPPERNASRRSLVSGILYVLTTGCQWRQLPKDFPPKSTAHDYFVELQCAGVLYSSIQGAILADLNLHRSYAQAILCGDYEPCSMRRITAKRGRASADEVYPATPIAGDTGRSDWTPEEPAGTALDMGACSVRARTGGRPKP